MTGKSAFSVVVFVVIFAIPIALATTLSNVTQDSPGAAVPEAKSVKKAIKISLPVFAVISAAGLCVPTWPVLI